MLGLGGGDGGHRLPCSREGVKEKHADLSLLPPEICCSRLAKPSQLARSPVTSVHRAGSLGQNMVAGREERISEDGAHTPIP